MKNRIIQEIQSLKSEDPNGFKELKKEIQDTVMTHDISTDDEHTPRTHFLPTIQEKHLPNIKPEVLKTDNYGNSLLSVAIEEGNMDEIKKMYIADNNISDAELLKKIAIDIMDPDVQAEYNVSDDTASVIYSEAKYQLKLMGEDISEIIDVYHSSK